MMKAGFVRDRFVLRRISRKGNEVQSGKEGLSKQGARHRAATYDRLSGKKHYWRLGWTRKFAVAAMVVLCILGVVLGVLGCAVVASLWRGGA